MATAKKKKKEAYPLKASASSGHTTNLRQSILRLSISMGLIFKMFYGTSRCLEVIISPIDEDRRK
jgi:hypothetical protein